MILKYKCNKIAVKVKGPGQSMSPKFNRLMTLYCVRARLMRVQLGDQSINQSINHFCWHHTRILITLHQFLISSFPRYCADRHTDTYGETGLNQ